LASQFLISRRQHSAIARTPTPQIQRYLKSTVPPSHIGANDTKAPSETQARPTTRPTFKSHLGAGGSHVCPQSRHRRDARTWNDASDSVFRWRGDPHFGQGERINKPHLVVGARCR